MKSKMIVCALYFLLAAIVVTAQVGIGTTTPGTTLDVNGGFTVRESVVPVAANTATIPSNVSMVRLSGAATGTITITAPAAPNAGQRLTIFNNTTGGFTSILNGFNIPVSQSAEFVYSNSGWQSLSPSGGSILPYASAAPATVTTLISGLEGTVALVGFGNSVSGIGLSGTAVDLTGGPGISLNYGFSLPRNGVIKSITASFSNVAALNLIGTTVTLKAQLYSAASGSNTYNPVSGAAVTLSPGLTGIISLGNTYKGIVNGLSIPVTSQSKLLLVISATSSGLFLVNTVVGYVSAGVSFD